MMCRLSQETIDDILRRGRIYEVGGAVRDKLLEVATRIKDRDYLVTGVSYDDLTGILRKYGRVDLVGRSFGVIKFTQFRSGRSYTFDITLPRREHSTGVAHREFQVAFDSNLPVEDDLVRRDFTINAMALALDNDELIDPLEGRIDLEKKQLRMTSDGSFEEDPLRMLRAVQLASRFGLVIEPETFRAIRKHASLTKTVSSERIAEEVNKLLLRAGRPSEGFRIMQTTGLLREVLPELEDCVGVDQPGGFHKYDVFEHTLYTVDKCKPSLRLRLAALFHDIRKPQTKRVVGTGATFYGHEVASGRTAVRALRRLRYPNDLIREVVTLIERHMFTVGVGEKGLRRLIRRVGIDLIFDLLDLRRADVRAQGMGGTTEDVDEFEAQIRAELERKPPFSYKDLAIDGHDIMRMVDLKPGPVVGQVLEHLLESVLDDPSLNSREALESLARKFLMNSEDSNADSDKET